MKWILLLWTVLSIAFIILLMGPCIRKDNDLRSAWIIVEVDHLSQAVQAYKEQNNAFPPCLADADPVTRKERFMNHVQRLGSTPMRTSRRSRDSMRSTTRFATSGSTTS